MNIQTHEEFVNLMACIEDLEKQIDGMEAIRIGSGAALRKELAVLQSELACISDVRRPRPTPCGGMRP